MSSSGPSRTPGSGCHEPADLPTRGSCGTGRHPRRRRWLSAREHQARGVDSGPGGTGGGDGGSGEVDPCAEQPDAGGDGWSAISLSTFSALAVVGGSVSVDLGPHKLAVAQLAEGCFVAVSRICTHEGCETAYDAGRFVCPCHGAVFDLDGSVLAGPTPIPVAAFPAARVGTRSGSGPASGPTSPSSTRTR